MASVVWCGDEGRDVIPLSYRNTSQDVIYPNFYQSSTSYLQPTAPGVVTLERGYDNHGFTSSRSAPQQPWSGVSGDGCMIHTTPPPPPPPIHQESCHVQLKHYNPPTTVQAIEPPPMRQNTLLYSSTVPDADGYNKPSKPATRYQPSYQYSSSTLYRTAKYGEVRKSDNMCLEGNGNFTLRVFLAVVVLLLFIGLAVIVARVANDDEPIPV